MIFSVFLCILYPTKTVIMLYYLLGDVSIWLMLQEVTCVQLNTGSVAQVNVCMSDTGAILHAIVSMDPMNTTVVNQHVHLQTKVRTFKPPSPLPVNDTLQHFCGLAIFMYGIKCTDFYHIYLIIIPNLISSIRILTIFSL